MSSQGLTKCAKAASVVQTSHLDGRINTVPGRLRGQCFISGVVQCTLSSVPLQGNTGRPGPLGPTGPPGQGIQGPKVGRLVVPVVENKASVRAEP